MDDRHVAIERERILTSSLVMRPWARDDAPEALEIYGDSATSDAIGRHRPIHNLAEMRDELERWRLWSSESRPPVGRWAVEAADDAELLGGATLLPFSHDDPRLTMGWHLRPAARGHGIAVQIGHALAHQAFFADDVDEVFVAAPERNKGSINVAKRLGMTRSNDVDWTHAGVPLVVMRMRRADLHNIRPRVSLGNSYNPEGLDDW